MNYNVKTIEYMDSVQIRTYKKPIHVSKKKPDQKIILNQQDKPKENKERSIEQVNHSMKASVNRTVNQIYMIARSNKWEYFVTLTINPEKLDNTDFNLISEKLNIWTNNLKKRYAPDLKYIIVPELHKDKTKWHFHGLFANIGKMPLTFSGKVCVGKFIYDYVRKPYATKIYNIPLWKYGFSTATIIRDSGKASSYITKYITKDLSHILQNQHRYVASQNIKKPIEQVYNIDFPELERVYSRYLEQINYISDVKVPKAGQEITYMEFNRKPPDMPLQDVVFKIFEQSTEQAKVKNISDRPDKPYKDTKEIKTKGQILTTKEYINRLRKLRSEIKENPDYKKIYDDINIDFLIAKAKRKLMYEEETQNEQSRSDYDDWMPATDIPF